MKKKLSKSIVFTVSLLLSLGLSSAAGEESPKPVTTSVVPAGGAAAPLLKGQAAPFNGVLFSTEAAQKLQAQINAIPDRIKVEVEQTKRLDDAQCTYMINDTTIKLQTDNKITNIQLQEKLKQLDFLEKHLAAAEKSRPNTVLWTTLGVGIGSAMTVLLAFATANAIH